MARGNKNYTEQYILDRALRNLEKLDVVGITEKMNQMIVQVSVFFCVKKYSYIVVVTTNSFAYIIYSFDSISIL